MKIATKNGPVQTYDENGTSDIFRSKVPGSYEIIQRAIREYQPKKVLLLFSGGHDSLCSTHCSAQYLSNEGIDFSVYHGNTGIGIRETREYVYRICRQFSWNLFEGKPAQGQTYEDIVRQYGFPGPASHKYMYRMLKERALRKYVTHTCKSSAKSRENVLLLTGIRQSESKIRMGYKEYLKKEGSRVWCSPLFFWTTEDIKGYMADQDLPRNPVKDAICISGECLCGAFAGREEWFEIQHRYPEAATEIKRLHKIAAANGHPWGWASNPNEYSRSVTMKSANLFMCVGCEDKNRSLAETEVLERKAIKRERRQERIREFHRKK
jgi:3'-phosphoadenosine 5'-phosphosulfate sulfotransferase (PAPS reductase)/FAD synthetase